jgi:uncharacterized protein
MTEQQLTLNGLSGTLEAILQSPKNPNQNILAVLGHPHSLYGGTMQNKVVTTLARAFQDCGISSLRFNFRGVGQSQGVYDHGIGESDDMLTVMKHFQKDNAKLQFYLAGFSFGSYVAYRTAALYQEYSSEINLPELKGLISVAPAVDHYDFTEYKYLTFPWSIIQGEEDDTALPKSVYSWHEKLEPQPKLIKMPDTGHFFHSRLGELKEHLIHIIQYSLA